MITVAWLVLSIGISTSLIIIALAFAYRQYSEVNKNTSVVPVKPVALEMGNPLEKRLALMNERFAVPMQPNISHVPPVPPVRPGGPGRRREP